MKNKDSEVISLFEFELYIIVNTNVLSQSENKETWG
jgi:hypothetical protein